MPGTAPGRGGLRLRRWGSPARQAAVASSASRPPLHSSRMSQDTKAVSVAWVASAPAQRSPRASSRQRLRLRSPGRRRGRGRITAMGHPSMVAERGEEGAGPRREAGPATASTPRRNGVPRRSSRFPQVEGTDCRNASRHLGDGNLPRSLRPASSRRTTQPAGTGTKTVFLRGRNARERRGPGRAVERRTAIGPEATRGADPRGRSPTDGTSIRRWSAPRGQGPRRRLGRR